MKLIIAEKPSLAKNIMQSLGPGKFSRKSGYFESKDYIVTWAFGHLFGLLDLEGYSTKPDREEKPKWTLDGLPFRPPMFRYTLRKDPRTHKVDPGVRTQFHVIKKLCAHKDVDCIIHAGDADREGEIIIRTILDQAGNKKPVKRLWLPDQTAETIRAGLRDPEDDANYDALANEGYARSYIDWIYGINLTRLATLKSGTLLRVGRVVVPIVQAIYDRDMEIQNFVPHKYLALVSKVEANGATIELTSKKTFEPSERSQAQSVCDRYNRAGAVVTDIVSEEKTIKTGKLFSLSSLQGLLGKKFKMSPKESLAIIQSLYESGYVTYPRTNTEYLATAERSKINAVLDKLMEKGFLVAHKDKERSIYDDSKIESHSALTPTGKLASREDLSEKEWQVYSTILNRFLAVFCLVPCKVNRTTITIEINGGLETFRLKGDVLIERGWMRYEESSRSDKILPPVKTGDTVSIDFKPVAKETSSPKHYTVDSLNKFLKNPFKTQSAIAEDSDEDETFADTPEEDTQEYKAVLEGVEIGTEATRTAIIDNAIHSGYISLKNNTYRILPGGEFLIQSLRKLGINMNKEKTAELGRVLKRVYRCELSVEDSVALAFQEVCRYFTTSAEVTIARSDTPNEMPAATPKVLGKCPKNCGGNVIEGEKGFFCTNKACRFALWKNDRFFASIGKKLTAANVKSMLNKGKISLKGCTSKKTGKKFDCIVTVDFSSQYPHYKIQ